MTPHDEDNLHGSKLWHLELPTLDNGVAEFVREDAAEEPDGDGLHHIRARENILVVPQRLKLKSLLADDDDHRELEACSDACHNGCDAHDDVPVHRRRGDADDPDL